MLKVKINKYLILLLGCFLVLKASFSQNFVEDFKKINLTYTQGSIGFNIKFDYYNDYLQKTPSYSVNGNVKIKEKMMYYKMNDIELSYDTLYTCMVDHQNKTIMIDTVFQKANLLKNINFIDSLSQAYQSVSYKDLGDNKAEYTIYSSLPGISHSIIVFNKTNYLIQNIAIFFLDNRENAKKNSIRNKLIIKYQDINQLSLPNSVFKPSQFVTISGKKIRVKEKYKNYTLINNIK
ncbi:MAG: hypothetical protein Q8K70_00940 [Bacteroidota bacterium]|nr:hypothetical protein [Bacteroidota bacterium]